MDIPTTWNIDTPKTKQHRPIKYADKQRMKFEEEEAKKDCINFVTSFLDDYKQTHTYLFNQPEETTDQKD